MSATTAGGALGLVQEALMQRLAELRRHTHLRLCDSAQGQFDQELRGLEASVRAVEACVKGIKAHIASENSTIHKVEAIICASSLQGQDIQDIQAHLPPHLPSLPSNAHAGSGAAFSRGRDQAEGPAAASFLPSTSAAEPQQGTSRKERHAPRAYITEQELHSLSSYMRGRLTLEKVNSAIDELAACAEANHRLMASARASSSKLSGVDRKRATELFHSVAIKAEIKGRFWFVDNDLQKGVSIRPDKTGKSILTLLRHLKRLEEVRCSLDGSSVIVYLLT